MSEPHKLTGPKWWHSLWWLIRGGGDENYRKLCRRCDRTGQAHWGWRGCIRFKT
jgi:hypothetical protein